MSSSTNALEAILHVISMTPPVDYENQQEFLEGIENGIKQYIDDDFETNAESEYEKVFQALVQRRLRATDETVSKMNLYRLLYERIRSENIESASLILTWLQPPQCMVDLCQFNNELATSQYNEMLNKVQSSDLDEATLKRMSSEKATKWIKKQAFVVSLACSCQELCEIVWRFFTKEYSSE
jgi:hypothetical protein